MNTNEKYEVRDPVYGFIDFNDWEKEIINHDAFQRLRRIRQLALADMVYPGATHTRFEHSLGVMHLATLMFDAIVKNKDNRNILKEQLSYEDSGLAKDRQLIRLAALLHDVGHGPFSHASGEIMPINNHTGENYTHEDYTTAIVKGDLKDVIESHTINKTNFNISAEEVAALIENNEAILEKRIFWKVIISSQLDADRSDYLLRDSHHIGVKYGIYDNARLLNTLALGIDPKSKVVLGVNKDGWPIAEAIIIARYRMFTQVYFHKTVRAFDYHLIEAMKKVLDKGELPPPENIEDFMKFDDNVMWALFKDHDTDPNCKSILTRKNFIKKVYSTPETTTEEKEEEVRKNKRKLNKKNIWYIEDKDEKSWYKLNANEEIMIIEDGKPYRLSKKSYFVKNINKINQIRRIYTKSKNREVAEKELKSVLPLSRGV